MTNKFTIKINKDSKGNQLSLDNITLEAAEALKLFIESLSSIANTYQNKNDFKISIKNGSIESSLVYPADNLLFTDEIENIINGKGTNQDTVKELKHIQNKIKQNGLDYSVFHTVNNQKTDLTTSFKSKNFTTLRTTNKEYNYNIVFIDGSLYECGGKVNTNIHIEKNNQEHKIECSKTQAKKLNELLYANVFLSVIKKESRTSKPSYLLLDSYLNEKTSNVFKDLTTSILEAKPTVKYDIVHDYIVNAIEREHNMGNILKLMRLFAFKQADRGIIRTILMTLKPIINQNQDLRDDYILLSKILNGGK